MKQKPDKNLTHLNASQTMFTLYLYFICWKVTSHLSLCRTHKEITVVVFPKIYFCNLDGPYPCFPNGDNVT